MLKYLEVYQCLQILSIVFNELKMIINLQVLCWILCLILWLFLYIFSPLKDIFLSPVPCLICIFPTQWLLFFICILSTVFVVVNGAALEAFVYLTLLTF